MKQAKRNISHEEKINDFILPGKELIEAVTESSKENSSKSFEGYVNAPSDPDKEHASKYSSHNWQSIDDIEDYIIDELAGGKYTIKIYINPGDYQRLAATDDGFKYLISKYSLSVIIDSNMKSGYAESRYYLI